MKIYPSDLSELEWEKIEVVFKVDYSRGRRPPKHSKRELYINFEIFVIFILASAALHPIGITAKHVSDKR